MIEEVDRSLNKGVKKRKKKTENMLAWNNSSDFKELVSAPFHLTFNFSQSETGNESRESDRDTLECFKMLSNKPCQTYRSCEAPAVNTQPTCIYLYFSSVIICNEMCFTETN